MKTLRITAVLLCLLALPLAALAWDGYTADRYYGDQLEADERAVYDALAVLEAPDTTDPVDVRVWFPEPASRYSTADFVYAAWYAYQYDRPEDAAWMGDIRMLDAGGREFLRDEWREGISDTGFLDLRIIPAYTREEIRIMDLMLEGMTDAVEAGMDRYARALYLQQKVSGRLQYDYDDRFSEEEDTSPMCIRNGYAVCEGFSKVYKILADKLALPCVLSGGSAHMCVQVQMEDGGWYIVEPQGSWFLAGVDAVGGIDMYYPTMGPAHWNARDGHGAILYPPVPPVSYGQRETVPGPVPADDANLPWDMGTPRLDGWRFGPESMNIAVYWVQVQLKATGQYYTGDQWDETGSLGDHTRSEIARFMKSRGVSGHDGWVDQSVVDELSAALGGGVRPVLRGGYYRFMDSILDDPAWCGMTKISRDGGSGTGVRWVQTCLSMLGYYGDAVDGNYGSATARAVRAFQRDHGFVERDYVTYGVARAMLEACWQQGCDLSRLP